MYLHLGGDTVVDQKKIVAILDLDTAKAENEAGRFFKRSQITDSEEGEDEAVNSLKEEFMDFVNDISESGKQKSLIITTDGHYFSPISTRTLLKRSSFFEEIEEVNGVRENY
ncbi:Hypothetical protein DEACI_0454 [Acididesulfobacillus acetoxydans]|uniref:DUF370 domain-containing protein n=1 Tax=Acididesulfobacillus acetoxydans TaxID=1561005 RepID=A0A8S0Y1Q9_9FIRM|nr:DUF370 domain-containing protein [Acididesulfobacillus acetoxydans]CAA7599825.1 Hypothetical protein DEACI_0454 [Acididesulfobacillus acetoxydans]CEJ07391.1 Hypothetical protein DEACI_1854 [Acididesulfobacillus acetoxydans]